MKNNLVETVASDRARKTFYPTPEPLAEKLLGDIDWHMIGSILEPSAGKGDLARYCAGRMFYRSYHYPARDEHDWRKAIEGADIDCIEIDMALRATLDGTHFRVVHDDFLTYETQKRYDLIVMNPPFDVGAAHLLKALELMERGGMIRCILNAETIRNPFTEQRRELIKRLNAYGAQIEYVSGAFAQAERRTDVDAALIRVDIPVVKLDSTIMDDMRKAPTYKAQRVPNEYREIVQYDEIERWVSAYNFESACGIRLIEEYQAMREALQSDPGQDVSHTILELNLSKYSSGDSRGHEASINEYLRDTRMKYWQILFYQPVITDKLTHNLQNELWDNVKRLADYEFSAHNIISLIIKMNQKVIKGIEDTIVEMFDDWTRKDWHKDSPNVHYFNGWKTNNSFRVGKKVILPFYGAYSDWSGRFRSNNVEAKFRDIEKVFDFLDNGRTCWAGDVRAAFAKAEEEQNTRSIDTKYFTVTFYKKGTAHFVFKSMDLLEKFNMFACQRKGWLPPTYGKKHYKDMTDEEKAVVDSFQGETKYAEVMARPNYFLNTGTNQMMMLGPGV